MYNLGVSRTGNDVWALVVVDIYRDTWVICLEPCEYSCNRISELPHLIDAWDAISLGSLRSSPTSDLNLSTFHLVLSLDDVVGLQEEKTYI